MGREILLLTAYFQHLVGLRSEISTFLMRDTEEPILSWRLTKVLSSLVARLVSPWRQCLDSTSIAPVGSSHTCRVKVSIRWMTLMMLAGCR